MKTLGRILLILAVFTIVMGITYFVVDTGSTSTLANVPAFERDNGRGFRPEGGQPQLFNGQRPEFDGAGPRGGGWMFGMIKNAGIIAVIVALIVVPKSMWRKRIGTISASAE
jgi:hypothetical protein